MAEIFVHQKTRYSMTTYNSFSKALLVTSRQTMPHVLFVLIALFILVSCDNDDDGEATFPSIEGIVWVQTSYEYVDCNSEDSNGGATLSCTDQNCQSVLFDNGIAEYTEVTNGTAVEAYFPYTLIGDDRFSSGGLTATYEIIDDVLIIRSFNAGDGCTLVDEYRGS